MSVPGLSAATYIGTLTRPTFKGLVLSDGPKIADSVSTSTGGLWSGSVFANIHTSIDGISPVSYEAVWTGSVADGSEATTSVGRGARRVGRGENRPAFLHRFELGGPRHARRPRHHLGGLQRCHRMGGPPSSHQGQACRCPCQPPAGVVLVRLRGEAQGKGLEPGCRDGLGPLKSVIANHLGLSARSTRTSQPPPASMCMKLKTPAETRIMTWPAISNVSFAIVARTLSA